MMLFVGAGLLLNSFVRLSNVDLGFDPTNVLTFQVVLPSGLETPDRARTFAEELVTRLQSLPDVQFVSYSAGLPMVWSVRRSDFFKVWPPPPPRPLGQLPSPSSLPVLLPVSRDYLGVMDIRVTAGRGFADAGAQDRVMLINEAMARRAFPGEDPLGRTVYAPGGDGLGWQIVGLVEDSRFSGIDCSRRYYGRGGWDSCRAEPQYFLDLLLFANSRTSGSPVVPTYFAVRTHEDPVTVLPNVRAIVRQFHAQAAVDKVATMEQLLSNQLLRPRFYAYLLGFFCFVAVGLAAVGIYGVMGYVVALRSREIGIRMVLGASRRSVLSLVVGQGAGLTAIGLALGLGGAIAVGRYLDSFLFNLTPVDPSTLASVTVLFALVSILAAYLPARRAAALDPLASLRHE